MRIRTQSVVVMAALLAIVWATAPPGPAVASSRRGRAGASLVSEIDSSISHHLVSGNSARPLTTMAWAQGVPRLPAGSRSAPASRDENDEMRSLEIPVRTRSPFIRGRADPAQIKRTTRQLESLLKVVQPEFSDLSEGQLPKDLIPNLKRIEKLSKQLRRQIAQ